MKNALSQLLAYYKQHRWWILSGLVFVFGLQLCNQIGSEQKSHPAVKEVLYNGDDSATASFEELYSQNEVDRPKGELNTLLIMTGLVLLVFVATRRGWLLKLMPPMVIPSLKISTQKGTKGRLAKFSINNHTRNSLTFYEPVIIFGSLTKKARKFRIKGGDSQNLFPLILTPSTSHQLNIRLEQFLAHTTELKHYSWVRIEISASNNRAYKTRWHLL